MAIALLAAFPAVGWAQTTGAMDEAERRAQDIYQTMMSPFCPGRTIDACPSPYAAEWREDIRRWTREGVPTEEIRRRLRERTPDKDLTGAPSTAMDAVLPYFVSVLALVLLGLLLWKLLRQPQRRDDASEPPPERKLDDKELDARLERELQGLED